MKTGELHRNTEPFQHWFQSILDDVVSPERMRSSTIRQQQPLHVLFVWGFVSASLALIYQISVTEAVEFDSQRITVCKEIRGWEREKEYSVENCSQLEWSQGSEGQPPALNCKVGWRTVKLCQDLSEDESIEILAALQRSLPDVAQKVCSYPNLKEHFLTLGLDKQK
jgi:hypothetical protein